MSQSRVLYSQAFGNEFLGTVIRTSHGREVEAVLCDRDLHYGSGYLAAISAAAGCPVGCRFCDMSELPYDGNLYPNEVEEELNLLLDTGRDYGFDVDRQPLKIGFLKGGEALLNPEFPDVYGKLLGLHPRAEMKVSSTFPDSPLLDDVYNEVVGLARTIPGMAYLQVSLISTDPSYRRRVTRMRLLPFEEIAERGEAWFEATGIKPTLTMTVVDATPCEPEGIRHVLTPDTFAVRLRDWVPNDAGRHAGLSPPNDRQILEQLQRFEDAGYQVIPGRPNDTELRHGICSGHFLKELQAVAT